MRTRGLAVAIGLAAVALVATGMQAATEDANLPANYRQSLTNFTTVDRVDTGQVRVLYGAQGALDAVKAGRPAPSGSVMVMEIYAAQRDAQNQLLRGGDGRLQRGNLTNIFLMEKRTGWGAQYGPEIRNGEWEYAIFTPAGVRAENRNTQPCMTCHLPRAGNDFLMLPATARENLSQIRYNEGTALLDGRRFAEAAERFAAAIALTPQSAEAHNNLGVALASMGRVAEARRHFQEAVALRPDFAEAARNLAGASAGMP